MSVTLVHGVPRGVALSSLGSNFPVYDIVYTLVDTRVPEPKMTYQVKTAAALHVLNDGSRANAHAGYQSPQIIQDIKWTWTLYEPTISEIREFADTYGGYECDLFIWEGYVNPITGHYGGYQYKIKALCTSISHDYFLEHGGDRARITAVFTPIDNEWTLLGSHTNI
jgi:hypothetical protein